MRKAGIAVAALGMAALALAMMAVGLGRAPALTGAVLVLALTIACIYGAVRDTRGSPSRRALVGAAKGLALAGLVVAAIAGSALVLHRFDRAGVGPGLPYRPLVKPPLGTGSTS